MLSHQLRQAITDCHRSQLPRLSAAVWKVYAAGDLSDAEAETLSALLETRKIVPAPKPGRHWLGSQPRTPESLQRRRRWVAAGRMPPKIAAHFTMGEGAVLALIAAEVKNRGDCRLPIGQIAAVAGVCVSTARNALRKARVLGLLTSEERRLTHRRNDTNIVCIISPEWRFWLKLDRCEPVGVNSQRARIPNKKAIRPMANPAQENLRNDRGSPLPFDAVRKSNSVLKTPNTCEYLSYNSTFSRFYGINMPDRNYIFGGNPHYKTLSLITPSNPRSKS